MKKKILVLVSILLVAVMMATVLASCSTGKYYFRDSDGKLIKDGAYLIVAGNSMEYKDKDSERGDYIVKGSLKETSKKTSEFDGKKYETIVYQVIVKSIKIGDENYKLKDGGWVDKDGKKVDMLTSLFIKGVETANSTLLYDKDAGMATLGIKPMFKSDVKNDK